MQEQDGRQLIKFLGPEHEGSRRGNEDRKKVGSCGRMRVKSNLATPWRRRGFAKECRIPSHRGGILIR